MLLVGLTGGIGSGKSTVAGMLRDRGAVVVDADDLAREAVRPGTPGHDRVAARFGDAALTPAGEVDRGRLAEIVFSDETARRDLEAIVHPEVARLLAERVRAEERTDRVLVYAVPLLVEAGLRDAFDVVVSVAASPDIRVTRLVRDRGLQPEDARRRIAAQASEEARAEAADILVSNESTLVDLERRVDELWADLRRRADRIGGR